MIPGPGIKPRPHWWEASALRVSQRGGCMFPCSLEKIGVSPLFTKNKLRCSLKLTLVKFPCSQKFYCMFPWSQKDSLMFHKIPNIFQFLMLGYFHQFYFTIHRIENHPASTIHLFLLLDESHITSCSLAEISVDSAVRVMSSLVCWILTWRRSSSFSWSSKTSWLCF